jgi:hypothetical protein
MALESRPECKVHVSSERSGIIVVTKRAHNPAHARADESSDFVLVAEGKPPPRIALARERMLICRLYLGLLQTITDDYDAEFAAHSDSLAYRTIGIYVLLRTVICSPVRANRARAQATAGGGAEASARARRRTVREAETGQ